jgi:hypothetical protein
METDSYCLFADVGDCGGIATPCYFFCKPPATTDDQYLFGCTTKLETLIFQNGKIDMVPCNVDEFHVCYNHSNHSRPSYFKRCCLCKPFGRLKCSKSGLRTITKSYAYAAWKSNQIRFSLGRKMCTQCRNDLDKLSMTEEFSKECDIHFQWLYDINIVHTPSISTSDSTAKVLSQSFNDLIVKDKQTCLREFLQGKLRKYRLQSSKEFISSLLIEINFFDKIPRTTSFASLQPSSKQRFCRQSTKVLKTVLGVMSPNDSVDSVWQANVEKWKETSSNYKPLDKDLRLVLTSLAEAYNNAPNWTVRRQILSIMAKDVNLSTIRMFIPDLTLYRFNMARRHADFEGKGAIVHDARQPTIRYEDYQLEHFIEFIISPHICTDLPFGEKQLTLSTGETLIIPLTIRNLAPQHIITQYYNYCQEYYGNTFRPLGQSTLYSILNGCAASIRRSLTGLDSVSAEGSTAFDFLISTIDGLSPLGIVL